MKDSKTICPVGPVDSSRVSERSTVFWVKVVLVDEIVTSCPTGLVQRRLVLARISTSPGERAIQRLQLRRQPFECRRGATAEELQCGQFVGADSGHSGHLTRLRRRIGVGNSSNRWVVPAPGRYLQDSHRRRPPPGGHRNPPPRAHRRACQRSRQALRSRPLARVARCTLRHLAHDDRQCASEARRPAATAARIDGVNL